MNKFTIQSREIQTAYRTPINIVPFGDVHFACPQHAAKFFNDDCATWRKLIEKNTYFIGMGDYLEFTGYSECKKLRGSNLRQSTSDWIDERVQMDLDDFYNKIKFMGDRLLGLVQGNHDWMFVDGTTGTEYLCKKLGVPYLGEICYYRLPITIGGTNRAVIDLVVHHGKAGGKLYGTSVNQVADLRNLFREADIYIMGHNHDKGAWPVLHSVVDQRLTLKMKTQYLCRSGSYRRSYVPDTDDYVHHACYRPQPIGYIMLTVKFTSVRKGNSREMIKDIHCWS